MLLDYKSNKWWAALRDRSDWNSHGYTGVWLKNGISYYFDLVVQGQRYRQGGFKTAEEAALARDCVIVSNRLPHRKSFGDSHNDYLVCKYGFYDLKVDIPVDTSLHLLFRFSGRTLREAVSLATPCFETFSAAKNSI